MKKIIKENLWFIITLIIIIALFNIRLPYYISAGGGTIDISDRIQIENKEDPEINGSLNMLYVTEYEATIPTYLLSFLFKDWELEEVSEVQINEESTDEIYERNRIMLNNSIQNAIFVAYNAAEKNIKINDYTNYVIATTSDNGMKIGDEIKEINGTEVKNIQEIKEIISESEVGDKLEVTIERDSKEKTISVPVYEENNSKLIGIAMITNYEYELDPEINVEFKKSESGSSGGLMMALSIYNVISGKDIVKGRNIAGTGTIDIEGNVGAIDGIKYKLMGAVNEGMDIVLVPKDNYEEAKKVKEEKNYDIEIVSVETFNDAIEYLMN